MNYIRRTLSGIALINQSNVVHLDEGLTHYLNRLCLSNVSTLSGRKKAARVLLNKTANIPIYINSDILLFPNQSLRKVDTVLVNYYAIYDIIEEENGTKIIFKDLQTLLIPQSIHYMRRQMSACSQLLQHLRQ